jgi:hypothetical protein
MAISPAISLPIVEHWQDFENLCLDLWSRIWRDPNAQKNGRSGQAQKGVDIYGKPEQGLEWAGVQCKHKEQLVGARLTRKEIEQEIRKARTFKPQLNQFVIATTSPRDASLQESVREIDDRERNAGSFSVTVFFWEDIVARLGDFPDLLRKYYSIFFLQFQEIGKQERAAASSLEVKLNPDEDLDYVALLPAYSPADPTRPPDLAVLTAFLSHIEVTNHDGLPTEVRRIWLSIEDALTQREVLPREVKEKEFKGRPKIRARSHQVYELSFMAIFDGAPQKEWRQQVVLHVEATGLGEQRIRLEETSLL